MGNIIKETKENKLIFMVLSIILTLIIGFLLTKIVDYLFRKLKKTNKIGFKFLNTLIKGLIVVFMVFKIGSNFKGFKELSGSILMSSSLIIAVLAFAFQKSLEDLIAGFMISLFRPFEVGDRITLINSDITGYVEDITLRHTIIRTFTNSRLIIPNAVMNRETLENSNMIELKSGGFLDVMITFESDIEKAKAIIVNLVQSHPNVINPKSPLGNEKKSDFVKVYVNKLTLDGINLRTTIWTKDVDTNFDTLSELREEIVKEFKKNEIEIACNAHKIKGNVSVKN